MRDKLVNGELDAAHVLYGLIYGVQMGIGGPKKDMAVLMSLNHNGQAITLSQASSTTRASRTAPSLKALMDKEKREYTFAQTFPTGTHAMWLYYWLAANGINPFTDAKIITVPPPQMVANMRVGNMDGFCVGEPWNNRAIVDKHRLHRRDHAGDLEGPSGEDARHAPPSSCRRYPNTARAMTAAVLEAGRWIDASLANRQKTAEIVADKSYVNTDKDVIVARMLGPLRQRHRQEVGRPGLHEVLQRRHGQLTRTSRTACGS